MADSRIPMSPGTPYSMAEERSCPRGGKRRAHGRALALAFVALSFAQPLAAQVGWPQRTVRVLVPSVPGGVNDLVTRVLVERMSASLGQSFLVDNRPGAGGSVAFEILSKANPDGYTLGMTADSLTIFPVAYRNLGFDPVRDLAPITLVATQPFVLAVASHVPAVHARALFELARSRPGGLTYGTPGTGTSAHFTGELLARMASLPLVHVPYKGGGAAIADLAAGQIDAAVLGASTVIPQARAGKVRILAVTTGKRAPVLPEVPTLAESGVAGFDMAQWVGLLGPAGLPEPIIRRLNAEVRQAVALPAVRDRLAASGFEPRPGTPQELDTLIREGIARWRSLATALKLRLD